MTGSANDSELLYVERGLPTTPDTTPDDGEAQREAALEETDLRGGRPFRLTD